VVVGREGGKRGKRASEMGLSAKRPKRAVALSADEPRRGEHTIAREAAIALL
jgi:hypothetical protein